jgi:cytochrome c oxidase cbb3-type subunit 3
MSSRYRIEMAAAAALIALAACGQREGGEEGTIPAQGSEIAATPVSGLIPGGGHLPTAPDPRAKPYLENAEAVYTGKRLYNQYNCVGCHFNGGGGIGPPLMDDQWIYGGRMEQIFATIFQGRPNGMPAWGGKIPEDQIWQIAAYVRSMSLPETLAANRGSTPSQHPAPVPAEAENFGGWAPPLDENPG